MEAAATRQHAHPNTVFHCLYGYYNLGYSRADLARIYNTTERTIGNWIKVYEDTGTFQRAKKPSDKKFTASQRQWLYDYYQKKSLSYLDEAQAAFIDTHHVTISKTSVWRIIHDFGLTWKVFERRAMHVKERDVFRFVEELSRVNWSYQNLVFLDEVSFDNRGMLRKRGYSMRGGKVAIRGDFQRIPLISVLAFIGANGVLDYFDTEGTFDRVTFTKCCQEFVYSDRGNVRQYPGSNSVWILDGATIHRHPEIIHYIRSVVVVPIFLPAYFPFFNPIEFMFGYMKKSFQRYYNESSSRDLTPFVVETFPRFESFCMTRVFKHCGWMVDGHFNPVGPMSKEKRTAPDMSDGERGVSAEDEVLFFF